MPSTSRFVANRAGLNALANGPKAVAAVTTEAEKGKGIAEGLAQEFRRSGHYANSFEVTALSVRIGAYYRAGARLTNTADYATRVELGPQGAEGKGHHVLARTIDALKGA